MVYICVHGLYKSRKLRLLNGTELDIFLRSIHTVCTDLAYVIPVIVSREFHNLIISVVVGTERSPSALLDR